MKSAYDKGAAYNEKRIKELESKGFNAPDEKPKRRTAELSAAAVALFTAAITDIRRAEILALYSAQRSFVQSASAAAAIYGKGGTYTVEQAVDIAQRSYLEKGIVGAVNSAGAESNIAVIAEAVVRNYEHKEALTGNGESARDYGVFTVKVSGHSGSCPKCYPWQDKVLIDDVYAGGKPDGKHELLSTAIAAGLMHYNCLHELPVFDERYDTVNFRKDIEPKDKNDEHYKRMQIQRYNERMIRQWKRVEAGSLTLTERENASRHVVAWQARQRELIKQSNAERLFLYRQSNREQIGGETKPNMPKAAQMYQNNLTINTESSIINTPIERNTAQGKSSAIIGGAELNKRQQSINVKLPEYDSRIEVPKRSVKMTDLSALSARNGAEYALFTKGNTRLIVRGSDWEVRITEETAKQMAADGWKWSGHTHLGTDRSYLTPSKGDLNILAAFGQKQSVIYNQRGEHFIFWEEDYDKKNG
jgi:hypothetical protein